jgi:rhamnose transport system ATP-binding protein
VPPRPVLAASLRALSKSFGAVRALHAVDLDLHAGEVHALVGENGAGKSTLIAILAGLVQADRGEIHVGGRRIEAPSPRTTRELGIAVLYQVPRLFGELSVAENLFFGRGGFFVSRRGMRDRAAEILARAGAEVDPRERAGELPLAKQQLVALARALGERAKILVLDEPTAVLPAVEAQRLLDRIARLRDEGVSVLLVSHRLAEVLSVADRITVLRDGMRAFTGPAREVDERALVRHMVGHELGLASRRARRPSGRTVLAVESLGARAHALADISFELHEGEVLGLAGLVGAGRSELLACLSGLARAEHGRVLLDGREIRPRDPRAALALGIAHLPEDRRQNAVIGAMSVEENLTLPRLEEFVRGGRIDARAERAFATDATSRFAVRCAGPDAALDSLSGGNQQKVALARWLACEPRVLFLDEPTQGIDVAGRAEIHRLIEAEAESGTAILLASSDLGEILELSDRIAVMRAGRLVRILPGDAPGEAVLSHALGTTGEA